MIRKLEHAFTALAACAAVLALGLLLSRPALDAGPAAATSIGIAAAGTLVAITEDRSSAARASAARSNHARSNHRPALAVASTLGTAGATPSGAISTSALPSTSTDQETRHPARAARRHRRQAFVMPYFSFAPRG